VSAKRAGTGAVSTASYGIHGWGLAIPRRRLPNQAVAEAWGRPGMPGARAIAGHDEDTLTLGVQAALQALEGGDGREARDPSTIDALIFATTTPPFAERSSAALLGDALRLAPEMRCIDMSSSLRAGSTALSVAGELVAGGACRQALVVAADRRIGRPGAPDEVLFGHAGVALLVGPADGAMARVVASARHGTSLLDTWRTAGETFTHSGDQRFARSGAYAVPMHAVLAGLLKQTGWQPAEVGKVVPYSPDVKSGAALLKRGGFDLKTQYCDLVSPHLGLTGTAHTPLMLATALEKAAAGEKIIVLGYGDGADGLALEMSAAPDRALWSAARKSGYEIGYNRSLALQNLHAGGPSDDGGFTSEIMEERNKPLWLALAGKRCTSCKAVITLPLAGCPHCRETSTLEEMTLARTGTVFAITHEHYYPTPEPPLGMATVDLDGGGRLTLQVADEDTPLVVGDPVELVFRRLHSAGDRPNYFWKCRRAAGPPGGDAKRKAAKEASHAS
jgi:3-hydroxy-3-methylglutaryl CoA synthase/uncharacterized OB-fold protein